MTARLLSGALLALHARETLSSVAMGAGSVVHGSASLLRREMELRAVNESDAFLEDADAVLARIVFDNLKSMGGSIQAASSRSPVRKNTLTQMCLASNEHAQHRAFLSSKGFHDKVREGLSLVQSKRLVIAGLWRQIGTAAVTRLWAALTALGSFFQDYQIIMLENDSYDDTKQGIRDVCQSSDRAWCYTLTGVGRQVLHAGVKDRVKGLTALRQSLLMKVKEFDPSGTFDYVVMVDGDIFAEGNAGFDIAGAITAFTQMVSKPNQPAANAVCAFQVNGRTADYYDTFAHRGPECKYADLDRQMYCPASSCGGGMVAYSMAALHNSGCGYNYVNEQTCEHVPLNECLAAKGSGNIILYKPWSIAMDVRGMHSDWMCMSI